MNTTSPHYDLIVIGGGAAGFFGAISFAELSKGSPRILILEKGSDVLQKVKISGGGRCNVTHQCNEIREFAEHYPRGSRTLPGPLHRWSPADMIDWFAENGVSLKTEADGRMFPTTDRSQTIIDCFQRLAGSYQIEIRRRSEVVALRNDKGFILDLASGETLCADRVLITTGGTRNASGEKLAEGMGHSTEPAAPSLFTFKIQDPRIDGLAGLSVPFAEVSVESSKLAETGPVLITHWGLSGPGVLKLSARGASQLRDCQYKFAIEINWKGDLSATRVADHFTQLRVESGKRQVAANSQFGIPQRLWKRFCEAAVIPAETKWSNLSKTQLGSLVNQITKSQFQVEGKSMNKDEFVTCGGIKLKEVDFKTMESKKQPGLYFAGEVLNIDGLTGGFNFQSAWTTARIAGAAMADA